MVGLELRTSRIGMHQAQATSYKLQAAIALGSISMRSGSVNRSTARFKIDRHLASNID
jgi:hypothetical protein